MWKIWKVSKIITDFYREDNYQQINDSSSTHSLEQPRFSNQNRNFGSTMVGTRSQTRLLASLSFPSTSSFKQEGSIMGCCPSKPKTNNNADSSGRRRRVNSPPPSSRRIVVEQPRCQQRKPDVSQQTRHDGKRTDRSQSTKQHLNSPSRKPSSSEPSMPTKIKFDNSGLSVVKKTNANNSDTYNTPNRQQSLQPKIDMENVPLSKVRSWEGNKQNSDCNATKGSDLVDKQKETKRNTYDFTAIDIDNVQSPRESSNDKRKQFKNDQMSQPKIKEPLSPQQSDLKKSTNNDNQGQPMKANNGQISQHNRSVPDHNRSDQKEPSFILDYLMEKKETNCSVLNKVDDSSSTYNWAEHFLKKSTNNDNQGQPIKANNGQISQHNRSVPDHNRSDQKEPSFILNYLMEKKETNCSVLNKVDESTSTYNGAEHFESKMPSATSMPYGSQHNRSFLDQLLSEQSLMENKKTYGSVDDSIYTNNRAEHLEAKMPSSTRISYDSHAASKSTMQSHQEVAPFNSHSYHSPEPPEKPKRTSGQVTEEANKLDEAPYRKIYEAGYQKSNENKKTNCSVLNKVDDSGAEHLEAKIPSSNCMSYDSHAASRSTMQSHQESLSFVSHSKQPEKPKQTSCQVTEEANKLDEANYCRKLYEAGYPISDEFEKISSTTTVESFSEKDFSGTSNEIPEKPNESDEDVYQEPIMLDQGFMEIDSSDETMTIIPQTPKLVVDNRNYVPVFRDYNEIDENDLIDDLTESKINAKTYNQMIEMLNKIYEQAKPFHEKIDNFTELENSNAHYYIEESLRRCIDKLDDMFDDIGDIKALRDERKKVYKFVFPMFDRLDATVQENKLRIDGQKE